MLDSAAPLGAIELGSSKWVAMGMSVLIATSGIGFAAFYYAPGWKRFNAATAARTFGPLYDLFVHKWYFDEIYDALLVKPTLALSRFVATFDKNVIDGVVNLSARVTKGVSIFEGVFDKIAVDGLVGLVAGLVYLTGDIGRSIQTGRLRNYLAFLALAVVGLFAGVFYWIRA
jgi:NADH:ubiquinone oxidoreductase subunit 5 (subunit L)/multisubunit Na+/H+ antiporter MnhA subunit